MEDTLRRPANPTAASPGEHALGADPVVGGVRFGVWAPRATAVEVVIDDSPECAYPLRAGTHGYYSAVIPEVGPGARYRFRLDGGLAYPDPFARFQPDGPHGPSLVVDPAAFRWTDEAWRGVALPGQVIYELHVGAFTAEGTFDAAIRELPGLRDLGATLLEIMPVAEFPGRFNWGYDGVALFAPYHGYGDPEAFKRFVDAAHAPRPRRHPRRGLQPLRPDGNYLREFSPITSPTATRTSGATRSISTARTPPRFASCVVRNAAYWIARVPSRRSAARRDAIDPRRRAARTSSPSSPPLRAKRPSLARSSCSLRRTSRSTPRRCAT